MPRIAGVDIPEHRRLENALTSIYGIGPYQSNQVISQAQLKPDIRAKSLTNEQIATLQKIINQLKVEGELKKEVSQNITRLKATGSYRGQRHSQKLPARGQRTKTNARTKRGKRMTVGAYKKSALAKIEQQTKQKTT
jgi:small subunit ribosomal protein S13